MTTAWRIGGTDLRRLGYNIRTVDNWDSFPGTRIAQNEHPFAHGRALGSKGFYTSKLFGLAMDVFPTAPDGTVTLTPEAHIQQNIDELFGLLHAPGRLVTVQRDFGSPVTTREAQLAVLDGFSVGSGVGASGRRFALLGELIYPFWHELPQVNVVGATGSITNNGNAPVGDAVFTCTTAGRITLTDSGDYLEVDSVAGGSVVIDCGARTVKQAGADADARLTHNRPWLLDLEPGSNPITVTGAWNVDYYHTYF